MFTVETVHGTPYEMGLQHGRIYRHFIETCVHGICMTHTFQNTEDEMDAGLEKYRLADATYAPWMVEELQGISKGSGVDFKWIERLHLRVWNYVHQRDYPGSGCTGLGMLTPEHGLWVGGTLDDCIYPYVLLRRVPKDGIPHIMVAWAGSGWGHNGMNAAGLSLAQSSAGGFDGLKIPEGIYANTGTGGRLILQTCQTVDEALALLKRIRSTSNYVLGDARGTLRVFQGYGPFQAVGEPENGMVFATNHPFLPGLLKEAAKQGCKPSIPDSTGVRFKVLEKAAKTIGRSGDTMMELLRSHEGFPHSICRPITAMASLTAPQSKPDEFRVARYPTCRNPFIAYSVLPGK